LANPTRRKGALGHGHSSSGQLTSHAILYPIIGVEYQEPVRHVTCKLMGGGSWQPVCLKRSISACLKPSLRAVSVLQMQSAWLKSLQSWEDVSLIHAVFAHSSLTEAGKECWQASGKVMLAGLFACIPRYTFPRGCAILVCGCLALRRLPPTRSSCAHAFKFAVESTSTQFCW